MQQEGVQTRGREKNVGDRKTEDSNMQEQQLMRRAGTLEVKAVKASKRSPECKTGEQK